MGASEAEVWLQQSGCPLEGGQLASWAPAEVWGPHAWSVVNAGGACPGCDHKGTDGRVHRCSPAFRKIFMLLHALNGSLLWPKARAP